MSYLFGLLFFFVTGSSEGIINAREYTHKDQLSILFSTPVESVHADNGIEKHVDVVEVTEEEEVHHSRSIIGKTIPYSFKFSFEPSVTSSKLHEGYFIVEKITHSVPLYILLQVFRI
ncbi:MAG: hypothetical protein H6584_02595 [Flavobacteriales bacterium]|nr:hypothetical protein [Flavobacteriales bacterium]